MIFWVDAQLPPLLAAFLRERFGVDAYPLRELGLRDAEDEDIFYGRGSKMLCSSARTPISSS